MLKLGLTGGIGTGKTTTAALLVGMGIPVIDTDDVAHAVVAPGTPGLQAVVDAFGNQVLTPTGELDRARLASIVFQEPAERKRLEAILHPLIRTAWQTQLAQWEAEGKKAAMVAIPLLFETGAEKEFDFVIGTGCSARSQVKRLQARGWTMEELTRRLAAQLLPEKKLEKSNYVIWTDVPAEAHAIQVRRVLDKLGVATMA